MRDGQAPIRKHGSEIRSQLREIHDTVSNIMDDDDVEAIKQSLEEIATYDLGSWVLFNSADDETEERLKNNPDDQQVLGDALSYGEFDHYSIFDSRVRIEFSRAPEAQYPAPSSPSEGDATPDGETTGEDIDTDTDTDTDTVTDGDGQ